MFGDAARARGRPRSGRARGRSGSLAVARLVDAARSPTARAVEVGEPRPTLGDRCRRPSASGRCRRRSPRSPRPVSRWPALFANASTHRGRRAEPRGLEAAGRVDEVARRGAARSSGVAAAVASSQWSTAGALASGREPGPVRIGRPDAGRLEHAVDRAGPASRRRPARRPRSMRIPPVERDAEQDVVDVRRRRSGG